MIDALLWIGVALSYLIGTFFALDALWQGRTSQTTLAWVLGLVFLPFISVPLYAFFGSRRFHGYIRARRHGHEELDLLAQQAIEKLEPWKQPPRELTKPLIPLFFSAPLDGNATTLLTTGRDFYGKMFESIRAAKHSVCIQFYILRSDVSGNLLGDLLCLKAKEGVKIYVIYDEIGSNSLQRSYIKRLKNAGVHISPFNSSRYLRTRMQINFRNHRKLVICDGETAYVGGYNFADEYLGTGKVLPFWRDTHLKIEGPAALSFQIIFCEDWHWATHELPNLHWPDPVTKGTDKVMSIASGPADKIDSASLYFTHLIQTAKKRCWLVSPYFVPDDNLVYALELAGLRGIDVRVLVPNKSDSWFVQQAMRDHIPKLQQCGVKFYSYRKGFLHQKVVIVDDDWSSIGSCNLDYRSLHINFELNALVRSERLNKEVSDMLLADFEDSVPTVISGHWWPQFLTKGARLLSPLL